MVADACCPECHGVPELQLVLRDRLVKQCTECGHRWNEEREVQTRTETGKNYYPRECL